MSFILNRLRELEGAASPDPKRAPGKQPAQPGPPARRRNHACGRGTQPGRRAAAFRVLGGMVTVFAAFLVWKAWKGEAPEGKTLAHSPHVTLQGRAPQEAVPQTPHPAPLDQEHPSPTPPGQTMVGAGDQGANHQETPDPQPPDPCDSRSPRLSEAQGSDSLTPEEDQRIKRILKDLKVTGVYKDASGYLAFINGRALQKGDRIGEIEIAEIASERIAFAFKAKRYIVRLH